MNTRCQYCGKEIAEGEDFCSDSCASAYRTATGTKLSDLKWLLIGIAVAVTAVCSYFLIKSTNSIRIKTPKQKKRGQRGRGHHAEDDRTSLSERKTRKGSR